MRAHRTGAAIRVRAEGLTVKALFITTLVLIAIGLAYFIAIGLVHN
jgi:hypothetical protein